MRTSQRPCRSPVIGPSAAVPCFLPPNHLVDIAEQLSLEYELALLIFLGRLVGFVVLPADGLLALAAGDVAHDVPAGGHAALAGLAGVDVYDGVEEVRLAMLAAEVLYGGVGQWLAWEREAAAGALRVL